MADVLAYVLMLSVTVIVVAAAVGFVILLWKALHDD